ncbi:alpha/beta hydrolase family protein [Aliiglaciecola sp.]|nr:alpha/beta hydrolase family protein [Aliiglaciecola sp.]
MTFERMIFTWFIVSTLIFSVDVCAFQSVGSSIEDIQQSQFEDQFETILVDEKLVPVVIQESNTAITRGVAVLLGESGRNPFSQHGLKHLTRSLNDVGWVTMVMPAPDDAFWPEEQQNQEPATTSADTTEAAQTDAAEQGQQTEEPEQPDVHAKSANSHIEQQAFERHEQALIMQMQAITQKTQQYPGFFLVIAQGTSAAWLTKVYSEKKLGDPDGLVVISPHWPDREYNQQLPQLTSQTQMPLLDIYTPWDTNWAKSTVVQRKVQSIKGLKLMYRQRELTGQKLDPQQFQRLGKEIYGWLTHMGW